MKLNNPMPTLKLGDRIYFSKYGSLNRVETIIKVTPTMFKTKNYNLKLYGDFIHICGNDLWKPSAQLATPELDQEWEKQNIISWFDSKRFTTEEKIKIYELLNAKI